MKNFTTFLTISLTILVTIDARSLTLSQKELKSVGTVLKDVLSHHLSEKQSREIYGTFTIEENEKNPDDFDISIDINTSETHNGVLSGKQR